MELKQASILLVDDEPFLREIMGTWLGRVAGQVFCAEDGAEALKILAANKIDLILSDVRMPVMDGIALLKKVKEAGARTPVILITGFSDVPLREAYDMGAEAILEKPITREELVYIAKRTLVKADELWREPPLAAPEMKLKITFDSSLTAALKEKRIAFGRRGFCIDTAHGLHEGSVEFAVEFRDDPLVLSGQGVVRWVASEEGKAGIEITYLDDASRNWVVDHVERSQPLAFIPGFAGLDSSLQANIA